MSTARKTLRPAAPHTDAAPAQPAPYTRPPILRAFAALGVPFRVLDEGALRGLGRVWERLDTIPDPSLPHVLVRACAKAGPAEGTTALRALYVRVLCGALDATLDAPHVRDAPHAAEARTARVRIGHALAEAPGALDTLRDGFVRLVPRTPTARLAASTMQAVLVAHARGPLADLDALCGLGIGNALAVWHRVPGGDALLARRLWEGAGRELREALDVALQATAETARDAFRGAVVADADAPP